MGDISLDMSFALVADHVNHKIRRIDISAGAVTTLAGSGSVGSTDATGAAASFNYPNDVSISSDMSFALVAGYKNQKIRRIPMAYCKADPTPAPTAAPAPTPTTAPTPAPTATPTLSPTVERGYILLKSGKYRRCDDGTQPDPNLEKCESCRSGFAGKNGRCEACKPNEVADVSSRECVAKVATPVWLVDCIHMQATYYNS